MGRTDEEPVTYTGRDPSRLHDHPPHVTPTGGVGDPRHPSPVTGPGLDWGRTPTDVPGSRRQGYRTSVFPRCQEDVYPLDSVPSPAQPCVLVQISDVRPLSFDAGLRTDDGGRRTRRSILVEGVKISQLFFSVLIKHSTLLIYFKFTPQVFIPKEPCTGPLGRPQQTPTRARTYRHDSWTLPRTRRRPGFTADRKRSLSHGRDGTRPTRRRPRVVKGRLGDPAPFGGSPEEDRSSGPATPDGGGVSTTTIHVSISEQTTPWSRTSPRRT